MVDDNIVIILVLISENDPYFTKHPYQVHYAKECLFIQVESLYLPDSRSAFTRQMMMV